MGNKDGIMKINSLSESEHSHASCTGLRLTFVAFQLINFFSLLGKFVDIEYKIEKSHLNPNIIRELTKTVLTQK